MPETTKFENRKAGLLDAIRVVTEHRIDRFPIPTNTSHLYEDSDEKFRQTFPHMTTIRSPIDNRSLMIGVFYEWMYRGNIESSNLLDLDRQFRAKGFHFVLVPLLQVKSGLLEKGFDDCATVRCVQLTPPKRGTQLSSDYFFYDRAWANSTRLINDSNFLSSQIYDHLKKLSHILLSDEAAPTYDDSYGKSSFGTNTYMALEDRVLADQIELCAERLSAVELGCGTGRHTFSLAGKFKVVDGYDFSAKMIEIAESRLKEAYEIDALSPAMGDKSLQFHTRDVEMFPPNHENIDLIAGLFGMGSFVEDVDALLGYCHSSLKQNGRVILSFYNSAAVVYTEPPPWRFSALSAELVGDADELHVKLNPTTAFRIYCKAWTPEVIRRKMRAYFEDVQVLTVPKASAIFPRDYPSPDSKLAGDLIRIEKMALFDESFLLGPYILASGMKCGGGLRETYFDTSTDIKANVKDLLQSGGLKEVRSFWENRRPKGCLNLQPVLGFAATESPAFRDVPIAIVRSWDIKLERPELNRLLKPIFGRSGVFKFADKTEVKETFGGGHDAVPSGAFKPSVYVALYPDVREASRLRFKIGDRIFETSSQEVLATVLGGHLIPAAPFPDMQSGAGD